MGGGILGYFAVEPIRLEAESRAPFNSELADDTIVEIEQVLGIVFSRDVRYHLRRLCEEHTSASKRAPLTRVQERKAKAAAKRHQAKEKARRGMAAECDRVAALLEHGPGRDVELLHSFHDLRLPFVPPEETARQLRCIAQAARFSTARLGTFNQAAQHRRRGPRPDGIEKLMGRFGALCFIAGVTPTRSRQLTPFTRASKILIVALFPNCSRLTEKAIAERIKKRKLFAEFPRTGARKQKNEYEALKSANRAP